MSFCHFFTHNRTRPAPTSNPLHTPYQLNLNHYNNRFVKDSQWHCSHPNSITTVAELLCVLLSTRNTREHQQNNKFITSIDDTYADYWQKPSTPPEKDPYKATCPQRPFHETAKDLRSVFQVECVSQRKCHRTYSALFPAKMFLPNQIE